MCFLFLRGFFCCFPRLLTRRMAAKLLWCRELFWFLARVNIFQFFDRLHRIMLKQTGIQYVSCFCSSFGRFSRSSAFTTIFWHSCTIAHLPGAWLRFTRLFPAIFSNRKYRILVELSGIQYVVIVSPEILFGLFQVLTLDVRQLSILFICWQG